MQLGDYVTHFVPVDRWKWEKQVLRVVSVPPSPYLIVNGIKDCFKDVLVQDANGNYYDIRYNQLEIVPRDLVHEVPLRQWVLT